MQKRKEALEEAIAQLQAQLREDWGREGHEQLQEMIYARAKMRKELLEQQRYYSQDLKNVI